MSMIRRWLLVWLLTTTAVVTVHGWGKQGYQINDMQIAVMDLLLQ
jgi:hypothetical protein